MTAAPTHGAAPDAPTTAPDGGSAAPSDAAPSDSPSREAAARRRQLRETEAERDQLRDQLDASRRREVERLAAARLSEPSDLLVFGQLEVDALLGDDGSVSAEAVAAAVDALLAKRPGLAVAPDPPSLDGGAMGATVRPSTSWRDVLGGRR